MNPLGIQISKFALVGIINTVIDLLFFNIFRKYTKLKAVFASYISSTIAMINSYFWNKYWTFGTGNETSQFSEATKFILSTVIGIYVIHNGVVYLLSEKILFPGKLAYSITKKVPVLNKMSETFVKDNVAKVGAIAISLIWNFLLYKFWVFK